MLSVYTQRCSLSVCECVTDQGDARACGKLTPVCASMRKTRQRYAASKSWQADSDTGWRDKYIAPVARRQEGVFRSKSSVD